MAKILDRLPVSTRDDITFAGGDRVNLKADEIIVWVSLSVRKALDWQPDTACFPAILDTAHTHYFSIQEQHLVRWAGLQPGSLRLLGHLRQAGRRLPLRAANLWLHSNVPGERDRLRGKPPQLLEIGRGIAVYPDEARFPRLPLIGMRTVRDNRLHIAIDGERQRVTLRTPDWRTRLLRWLA
jgi:hypothetical protein